MKTSPRLKPAITIDLKGYAEAVAMKGPARVALEPLANALDAADAHVTISHSYGDRMLSMSITDDGAGFATLSDVWTLYAPSTRRGQPDKRGRFGQGEKELIALVKHMRIETTSGTVVFLPGGRDVRKQTREKGTLVFFQMRMSRDDHDLFEQLLYRVITPRGLTITINQMVLPQPEQVASTEVALPTTIYSLAGMPATSVRKTTLDLYRPSGTRAFLYEMGIPVVEIDSRFDVDVAQKVPLNRDRDNVTPSYLRKVMAAVVELLASRDLIDEVIAQDHWVREAIPDVEVATAAKLITTRVGADAVIYDPSDKEASKALMDEGRTMLFGRSLTPYEHHVVKATGIYQPAGQIRPSGIIKSADGEPPVPVADWTPTQHRVAAYIRNLVAELIDRHPDVSIYDMQAKWIACASAAPVSNAERGQFSLNWRHVRDRVTQQQLDALVLHECAHLLGVSDHLTTQFNDALEYLGAKLRTCVTTYHE